MNWKLFCFLTFIIILTSCQTDVKKSNPTTKTKVPEINKLTQEISENDTDPRLYYERGKVYYNREAYNQAISDFHMAISIDSLNPVYYHVLADTYLDNFESKKALQTLEKVVSLFPGRIPSKLKLSEFYLILKDNDRSIQQTGEILALDPQNAEAFFMAGMNFKEIGDTEKAVESFKSCIEIDPELIDAWIILGEIYESKKDPVALDYYNGAIIANPKSTNALHAKAFYLQNHDNISGAINIYEEIQNIDKNYVDAPLNMGILFLELDSLQKAYDNFNIVVNIAPQNPIGHFYRGISNEYMGKDDLAISDFQTTLNLSPEFDRAIQRLESLKNKKK